MRVSTFLATLASCGVLIACGSDPAGTGGPSDSTCPDAQVPLCADAAVAGDVRLATSDAGARLAPALSAEAEAAVAGDLAALETALDAGNVTDGRAAALSLRAALAARRAAGPDSDLASLDAITLAVIQAELALGVTPAALSRTRPD
ncbi:MAG TPA: hypothetical protein VLA95_00205 [Gemmatimonadales bacterium]|nr:hypothetical protein [Gemmatimonadales bacterium]